MNKNAPLTFPKACGAFFFGRPNYSAASLSFLKKRAFSLIVAGLALNTVASFVKGLIPLRAFLAGVKCSNSVTNTT